MSKLKAWAMAGAVALGPAASFGGAAPAQTLGPHGAGCAVANRPAMLVRVVGLKSRAGSLRVQYYGGDPRRYFTKHSYVERIDLAQLPAAGPVEVCVPVRASGTYAVSVRHDANGNGETDMADGAGLSGNPDVSLMDVVLRRRPAPERVEVAVRGLTPVPIVMNYVQGLSVGPVASAGR